MREAKLYGRAVSREGKVWPGFSRGLHVIEPFDLPLDWLRFSAIDFGTRNPFACGWAVELPHRVILPSGKVLPDGSLVFYREHYQAEWTLRQHSEVMHESAGWVYDAESQRWQPGDAAEHMEMVWADPEDPQQLLQLVIDYDIDAVSAIKAVLAGIDVVADRLQPDADGNPGVFFFDTLHNHIRELSNYAWATGSTKKDQPNRPRKKDDHTCDLVRYLLMGHSRY